jgi:hypothetical protein
MQLSFRLDEGHGTCMYRLGVEDNGCHSLLDYDDVRSSACVLECLARSLNAVVMEIKWFQNEIALQLDNETGEGEPVRVLDESQRIVVVEPPIWETSMHQNKSDNPDDKVPAVNATLRKEPGVYTRAEVVIRRIETHLLDRTPIPLLDLTRSMEAMKLYPAPQIHPASAMGRNGDADSKHNGNRSNPDHGKPEEEKKEDLSVGETLSTRNIRIAVVGNVDAGMLFLSIL